jgi:hypothetical protein
MEEKNTLEPQYYLEYDKLKGMVIHCKPFSKGFYNIKKVFNIFFIFPKSTGDIFRRKTYRGALWSRRILWNNKKIQKIGIQRVW